MRTKNEEVIILFYLLCYFLQRGWCTQICSLVTFLAAWSLCSWCRNQFAHMFVLMCTLAYMQSLLPGVCGYLLCYFMQCGWCTQICSLVTFLAAWTLCSQCCNQFAHMFVLMCTLAYMQHLLPGVTGVYRFYIKNKL